MYYTSCLKVDLCCPFKQICTFFHRGKGSFSTLRWRRLFTASPMSERRGKGTERKSNATATAALLMCREIHLCHNCSHWENFAQFCKYSIFKAVVVAVLLLNLKCCIYLCNFFTDSTLFSCVHTEKM